MLDNLYLLPTPYPLLPTPYALRLTTSCSTTAVYPLLLTPCLLPTPYSLRPTPDYLVLDDGLVGREGGGDPEHALLDLMQGLLVLLGTPG